MSRASWTVVTGAFVLAFSLRLLNLPFAQIGPADDLYHWKRMAFSAEHFPHVLEFDPDRGVDGAFCPWPPLYDLFGGAVARVFGIHSVVWLPPILGAFAVALATVWIARRFGQFAAITAAIALATSPFIVTQSWIAAIDHHYLEWPLVFGILVTSMEDRQSCLSGQARLPVLHFVAMTAALFVQTALIIACGLSFIVCFARGDRRASGAFFASAAVVAMYRLTRSAGYPNSAWFLGWPHVILLAAAGVALLIRPRWLGLAAGIAVAATAPLQQGLTFFGGDAWLRTIIEFQPMWRSHGADLVSQLVGLGFGAILVWTLIRKEPVIALFAIVFLFLTIDNRRFWSISIPLLAIAGAIAAAPRPDSRGRLSSIGFVLIAVVPVIQLIAWMQHPNVPIERYEVPWLQAAQFLRTQPHGRVLAPWSMGHSIDVIGHQHVIIDGFGTMPDEATFWRATDALQSRNQLRLAHYCATTHVRYVVRYVDEPPLTAPHFHLLYRTDPSFRLAALSIWTYDA